MKRGRAEVRTGTLIDMNTLTCGWCAEDIPPGVVTCPHCQGNVAAGAAQRAAAEREADALAATAAAAPKKPPAKAGWYPDPEVAADRRYWNGAGWTERRYTLRWKPSPLRYGDRPEGLIWGAILLTIGLGFFASAFFLVSDLAGIIAAAVVIYYTSALFAIGIIAKGVELGIRAARHRPGLDF